MDSKGIIIAVILVIAAYLIGNISPATILAKAAGHNIKEEGSGNAGTTNVLRVVGPKAAIITLVIDVLKGFIAVKLGYYLMMNPFGFSVSAASLTAAWCGLAVFAGHVWPALLKFKGGKGVATALGVILAIDYRAALICLAAFLIVVILTRFVSLGSITAGFCFPFVYMWMLFKEVNMGSSLGEGVIASSFFSLVWKQIIPLFLMALLLIFNHRANIGRLIRGEENKLNLGKKKNKDNE